MRKNLQICNFCSTFAVNLKNGYVYGNGKGNFALYMV